MEKPIGILGGTFDPIHLGHLHLVTQVQQELNLAKIKIIPCYQSPLRSLPHASTQDRAAMIQLAILDHPYLELDERELKKPDKSYTIDTLRSLRQELPHTPLVLIMGSDAFAEFTHWQEWEKILNYTQLAIVLRPGTTLIDTKKLPQAKQTNDSTIIQQQLVGKIVALNINALNISSSKIRNLILQKKSTDHLLAPKVENYIKQRQLYTACN